MTWCTSCGAQYEGTTHNCGRASITNDRLRILIEAERRLLALESPKETP